ncbi:MAG TPA: penicillin-binding transpeptidase domain-containing protein [Kofleriaceae bacterium]|nr:penicillin-binding transpeptidase domain-containing protein [Kofleriaceae bacterium]
MSRMFSARTAMLAAATAGAAFLALQDHDRAPAAVAANLPHRSGASTPWTTTPTSSRTAEVDDAAAQTARRTAPTPGAAGDAHLKGLVDLSRATLRDGRYQVELPGGERAILTLDPTVQAAAEKALRQARSPRGAIVVMTPDGRIVALAGQRQDEADPVADPSLATSVWAPAASIFKVVTAAALIDAGVSPERRVCFHGGLRSIQPSNLEDHPRRDSQCQDLGYAISKSQNAVMAKLVHGHLAPTALRRIATAFGFASAPAFAIDAEPARADIPEQPLEFARVSAGFWHTELSPLGGALVAGTIATRGMALTPMLVDSVIDAQGTVHRIEPPAPQRAIPERVAQRVGALMVGTTETGTAYKGFHDHRGRKFLAVDVAGKTGTLTRQSPSYLQYSWFVGFAPVKAPRYIIAVLLGNAPTWHLKAHTAARLVLEKAL